MDWANVLDRGLYTVPVAARLLGAKPEKVRAWVEGYGRSDALPILVRQFPRVGGKTVLGFLDLVESAFVRHFRGLGFSPQTIRRLALKLREKHGSDHPFAMNKRFRDDGKIIFEEIVTEDGERQLVNLMNDNFELVDVVNQSLFERIFYVNDIAAAWRPLEGHDRVIIKPNICFGLPIVDDCQIPTATLFRSYLAEGEADEVALNFDVPVEDVIAAIRFERDLEQRVIH